MLQLTQERAQEVNRVAPSYARSLVPLAAGCLIGGRR
jgi:hypothetical protein